MPSSPPAVTDDRARPRAVLGRVDPTEGNVCFGLEGAGPEVGHVVRSASGLQLLHEIHGRVTTAADAYFDVASPAGVVRVRHLLPEGVRLRGFVGAELDLRLVHELDGDRATIDARIRDADGLVLWARDGRLPHGGPAPVRTRHGVTPRLVIAGDRVVTVPRGHLAELSLAKRPYVAVAVRVGALDAAFLLARL